MYTAASPGNLLPTPAGGGTIARWASRLQLATGVNGSDAVAGDVGSRSRDAAAGPIARSAATTAKNVRVIPTSFDSHLCKHRRPAIRTTCGRELRGPSIWVSG